MPFEKLKSHCLLHFSRDSSGLSNIRAIHQSLKPLVGNYFFVFLWTTLLLLFLFLELISLREFFFFHLQPKYREDYNGSWTWTLLNLILTCCAYYPQHCPRLITTSQKNSVVRITSIHPTIFSLIIFIWAPWSNCRSPLLATGSSFIAFLLLLLYLISDEQTIQINQGLPCTNCCSSTPWWHFSSSNCIVE